MKGHPKVNKIIGLTIGNIYLLEGDELAVIDTGCHHDWRRVASYIRRSGRRIEDLKHILLTPAHVDHAGSAGKLKRLSGARVYGHHADVPYFQADVAQAPGVLNVVRSGFLGNLLSLIPATAARVMRFPPVEVDCVLKDGDIIPLAGGLTVIHSPGHTPGTVCYYWEKEGILFTGDTIINTFFRFDLPTIGFSVDYGLAARSASRVVGLMDGRGLVTVCPGHGPPVSASAVDKLIRFRDRIAWRMVEQVSES